ncbi:MAG: Dethiobiotin synthase [Actinomycetia bacterium]|nr:Dethiobiotin synthase [Actinomycetes bacterium]
MTGLTGLTPPAGLLVVTGTGTGVGKTVVTAAIAALARAAGRHVAVVKPAQTGVRDAPQGRVGWTVENSDVPDIDTVTALSGVTDTHELARFPDPLSPEAAARTSGLPPLDVAAAADYVAKLATERDLVIVEGAGGLLVRYDQAGSTLADLAAMLRAATVVVAAAGLGTLNHTALTCEALSARGLTCAGVVVGSWPREPGLAERQNLADLPLAAGAPLVGVLPEGAGALSREDFLRVAREGLTPLLGGARQIGHAALAWCAPWLRPPQPGHAPRPRNLRSLHCWRVSCLPLSFSGSRGHPGNVRHGKPGGAAGGGGGWRRG